MVVHHAVGDDLDPAEPGEFVEDFGELLLAQIVEQSLTADNAGDAVVHPHLSFRRFHLHPCHAHGSFLPLVEGHVNL